MKKSLYFLLATFVALTVAGCSDDKGTEPGGDSLPVATIYTLETPAECDPDTSVAYRIVPNEVTNKIYVLTETADAKANFLASNTEDAYIEKVVKEGESFEAAADIEIVKEGLKGLNATTVVAEAANGKRMACEATFKGVVWVPAGKAWMQQNIAVNAAEGKGYRGYVNVERQTEANIFRVFDAFHQIAPDVMPSFPTSKLTFTFNDSHICTSFETSRAPFVMVNFVDADGAWFGYYDPVKYGSYCNVGSSTPDYALVSMLVLDNNAGSLYTGGQLVLFFTDEWEWYK